MHAKVENANTTGRLAMLALNQSQSVWRVFGNFEHARWMGERGRVKAAYGFSWDAVADQTEGVYRELL